VDEYEEDIALAIELLDRVDLPGWPGRMDGPTGHAPHIHDRVWEDLQDLQTWLRASAPDPESQIQAAIVNFARVLDDFLFVVDHDLEPDGNLWTVAKWYRRTHGPDVYEEAEQYRTHVMLLHHLAAEMTRALNLVVSRCRTAETSSVRGRPWALVSDGSQLFRATYTPDQAQAAQPYPGLRAFPLAVPQRDFAGLGPNYEEDRPKTPEDVVAWIDELISRHGPPLGGTPPPDSGDLPLALPLPATTPRSSDDCDTSTEVGPDEPPGHPVTGGAPERPLTTSAAPALEPASSAPAPSAARDGADGPRHARPAGERPPSTSTPGHTPALSIFGPEVQYGGMIYGTSLAVTTALGLDGHQALAWSVPISLTLTGGLAMGLRSLRKVSGTGSRRLKRRWWALAAVVLLVGGVAVGRAWPGGDDVPADGAVIDTRTGREHDAPTQPPPGPAVGIAFGQIMKSCNLTVDARCLFARRTTARVGDRIRVRVRLHNPGPAPVPYARVHLGIGNPDPNGTATVDASIEWPTRSPQRPLEFGGDTTRLDLGADGPRRLRFVEGTAELLDRTTRRLTLLPNAIVAPGGTALTNVGAPRGCTGCDLEYVRYVQVVLVVT
jgi:hypothetical protein